MARIRYLKPSFFDHEGLASVSPHARLAFAGLWLQADRAGRLKDEPTRLRVRIFPYETSVDMNTLLGELAGIGVLIRYDVSGVHYLGIPGFIEHQRPHPNEPPSAIPCWPISEHSLQNTSTRDVDIAARDVDIARNAGIRTGTGIGTGIGIGTGTGRAALITSPQEFAKRQERNAFVCERFDVPFVLHREFVGRYGKDAEPALQAWYRNVQDALSDDESIPDVFVWLRAKFDAWLLSTGRVQPLPPRGKVVDTRPPNVIAREAYERQTGKKLS